MNGGWVLDSGNIWCIHGDNVRYLATASSDDEQIGTIEFNTDTFAWEIRGTKSIPLGDVYEWHKI